MAEGGTKPPFVGTLVLGDIPLDEVEPYLNQETLFASRWQFRQGKDAESWERLKSDRVTPIFEKFMSMVRTQGIIKPAVVYGYFECEKIGNGLLVKGKRREFRFDFPRERVAPNRCLADLFGSGFAAFQLATVGGGVGKASADAFARGRFSDSFYLKGLAAEFAEAVAKYVHQRIRGELSVGEDTGERFSPGYPAFPNLLDQRKIVELLGVACIGVTVTETSQLVPEYSTSAIVSIDEKARHFRP